MIYVIKTSNFKVTIMARYIQEIWLTESIDSMEHL
jgi:hypothetical protein